ncbi:unnamed protein product [Rhizoctonia solani]|uniref:BTB domain-containing protein n=1 Tax=Rhizoctonia solani TaxID=456999 RepID=A0A8H3HTR8_9AGAM|nr:unnamed protein product [Rhizoctonia solani]
MIDSRLAYNLPKFGIDFAVRSLSHEHNNHNLVDHPDSSTMPKRASTASAPRRGSTTARSRKRTKVNEIKEDSPKPEEEIKEEPNKDADKSLEEDTEVLTCDPKYYFEDGNVTLRVHTTLFKVHASLLKAHSEEFFDKLNPLRAPRDGTTDIIVPDVQPSRFRNLMKLIYCLPSNDVIFGENKSVVAKFECYLDVAILSRKFAMNTMQKWSEKELGKLVHRLGKDISDQINDFYGDMSDSGDAHYFGDYHDTSQNDAFDYCTFHFVEAIRYARAVLHTSLLYDLLSILQHNAANGSDVVFTLAFFRIADLRKTDPSLFGFFFLLLLEYGNQAWVDKQFTQEERIALFSAQSFLTPLPQSLKESILPLLFTRPTSSNDFVEILSEDPNHETNCHKEIFSLWQKTFPASYYRDVNSREFSTSIKALVKLPLYRLDFSLGLHQTKCQACRKTILEKLDKDMQEVFTRLGGYYKVFD